METDRKENRLMAFVEELENRTEGLCRAGAGPGGIGISASGEAGIGVCLVFDPPAVQGDVVFPEEAGEYTVRTCAFHRADGRELTGEELGEAVKSENLPARKVAEALMGLMGERLCVSREECLEAFGQLAERELAEVYGEAEPEKSQGMSGISMC